MCLNHSDLPDKKSTTPGGVSINPEVNVWYADMLLYVEVK